MSDDQGRRERGLETMKAVYGWDSLTDSDDQFFAVTRDHLFVDIWNRPGLSNRDRRLLLIGLLTGRGDHDVTGIQLSAALQNGELDADLLREIVVFLAHYAGWPNAAKLHSISEQTIAKQG